MTSSEDRVIYRSELCQIANGVRPDTITKWIKAQKIPAPDVKFSHKTKGWRASTLRACGIPVPDEPLATKAHVVRQEPVSEPL